MSKFQVIKYSEDCTNDWDEFVINSLNGTIFHERKFINYHPKDRFKDDSLMFFDKEKLVAVFPAATIINSENKKILKSHPGTSYGGLVISEKISLKNSFQLIESLETYALENEYNYIEFRSAEKIFLDNMIDQLEFALVRNSYIREAEELSTYYDLKSYWDLAEDDLILKFNNKSKSKVRQNIYKGINSDFTSKFLENEEEYQDFYKILCSNLLKHNTKPVHSYQEMLNLLNSYPDRVKIFGVFQENNQQSNLMSAFLIFKVNHNSWHIFYSALDYNFQNQRPQNFCLYSLIKYLAGQKDHFLNFGISTEQGGKFINWGLFEFKESFNGSGAIRTYWKKELI